jgi:hypothetical protein
MRPLIVLPVRMHQDLPLSGLGTGRTDSLFRLVLNLELRTFVAEVNPTGDDSWPRIWTYKRRNFPYPVPMMLGWALPYAQAKTAEQANAILAQCEPYARNLVAALHELPDDRRDWTPDAATNLRAITNHADGLPADAYAPPRGRFGEPRPPGITHGVLDAAEWAALAPDQVSPGWATLDDAGLDQVASDLASKPAPPTEIIGRLRAYYKRVEVEPPPHLAALFGLGLDPVHPAAAQASVYLVGVRAWLEKHRQEQKDGLGIISAEEWYAQHPPEWLNHVADDDRLARAVREDTEQAAAPPEDGGAGRALVGAHEYLVAMRAEARDAKRAEAQQAGLDAVAARKHAESMARYRNSLLLLIDSWNDPTDGEPGRGRVSRLAELGGISREAARQLLALNTPED